MQQLTFATVSPYIIGKYGGHWPEYGGADRVFLNGMFCREALELKISPLSVSKYINGSTRFPRRLWHIYAASGGDSLLYANIVRMINGCPCVSHLLEVQDGVYRLLCDCDLPQETYAQLVSLYVPHDPTADDIARFLAAVLYVAVLGS